MGDNLIDQTNQEWIKAGSILVDLSSMEKSFLETVKRRQEIWDYIQYRESLVRWPLMNEKMKLSPNRMKLPGKE
jgi:hypothetical protein